MQDVEERVALDYYRNLVKNRRKGVEGFVVQHEVLPRGLSPRDVGALVKAARREARKKRPAAWRTLLFELGITDAERQDVFITALRLLLDPRLREELVKVYEEAGGNVMLAMKLAREKLKVNPLLAWIAFKELGVHKGREVGTPYRLADKYGLVEEMYKQGKSIYQIAKELGTSPSAVYNILKKLGLK